MLYQNEE